LKKLLRPGGKIAVISNDFAFHLRTWPEVRELDDLYDAYIASRRADEGDPCIGRRVPDLLRQAGLRLAGFEVEVAHNHLEGDRAFLLAEGAGIPAQLVQSGYLDEGVFQRLVTSWKAMLEHPDHTIMRPLFIAVGENSDEDDVTPGATLTAVPAPSAAYHLEHVAPTTDLERDITQIWADVIGLERVGVNQNFFDLGGTSLMLEHVQVRLETLLGSELPLTLLFQYPTVEALAASLDEAPPAEPPAPAPAQSGAGPTASYPAESPRRDSGESVSRQAQRRRDALMRRRSSND
jgi:acyl carrier protein